MTDQDPQPLPELPAHLFRTVEAWRSDHNRVKWLRDVLASEFGMELASIVRAAAPQALLTVPEGATQMATFAKALGDAQGTLIGMTVAHERLRKLIFETLATNVREVAQTRRPGEQRAEVAAHNVNLAR